MQLFSVRFFRQAETVAVDWFELTPADDRPIKIISCVIGQDLLGGDANEDLLPWEIIRGHTTSGSGGDVTTPRNLDPDGASAGFTCETNNTTQATIGTTQTLHSDTFNIRQGLIYKPIPEEWLKATQGNTTIVVRLGAAPPASITWTGTLYVLEL